jgi:hypothetical protein
MAHIREAEYSTQDPAGAQPETASPCHITHSTGSASSTRRSDSGLGPSPSRQTTHTPQEETKQISNSNSSSGTLGHMPMAIPRILRAASRRSCRISNCAAMIQILPKVKARCGSSLRQARYTSLARSTSSAACGATRAAVRRSEQWRMRAWTHPDSMQWTGLDAAESDSQARARTRFGGRGADTNRHGRVL